MNLIPSYNCNFNCPFCVVHAKNDPRLLDLNWFEKELEHIGKVDRLNIIGGEPTLLPPDYLKRLIDICEQHSGRKPSMYTNLSSISPLFERVELNVSINPGITDRYNEVFSNLLFLNQDFSINMIMTDELVKKGTGFLKRFLQMPHCKKLSISKYTHFCGPDFTPQHDRYIAYMQELIEHKDKRIHVYPIDAARNGYERDNSAEACAEVLPDNKYRISIRDFLFTPMNVFKEYDTWEELVKAYSEALSYRPEGKCFDCKVAPVCWKTHRTDAECEMMMNLCGLTGGKTIEHISELQV